MRKATFVLPWWVYLAGGAYAVVYLGLPLWLVVGGVAEGVPGAVVAGALFGVFVCLSFFETSSVVFRSAAQVTVDDAGIRAKPLLGKETTLRWEEIGEVRDVSHLRTARWRGGVEQLLLVAGDGRRRIAVGSMLRRFDELVAVIERCTPHARRTRDDRPFWKREILFFRR